MATIVDVGRDKRLAVYFQGPAARALLDGQAAASSNRRAHRGTGRPAVDLARVRRVVRPLMTRSAVIIFHVNRKSRCITGSWYGRWRAFRYFNHRYRDFDGDVITVSINPQWFRRRRVAHGPYYLDGAKAGRRRYPGQRPMDALVYVLAHEFAHQVLYSRRHPMRFSERATDLFTMEHLHRVEPRHPIVRKVRLTGRELGLLLAVLRRMPSDRAGHRRRRHRRANVA